jgi:outer membrane protein OmpU
MKKVLFATTALIATAGMAAAETSLTFGGSARFGVLYQEDRADAAGNSLDEFGVHNRFTLNIDGTSTTDSGLEFFARVRIRGGNSFTESLGGSGVSAPRVGVRSGGFTLAVGNINGAFESTPGLYSHNVGLTGLSWSSLPTNFSSDGAFQWDSFSSAGAGSNGVEAIYSAGNVGFHLSHSEAGGNDRTAAHISYKFNDWTVALGHQESDTDAETSTLLTVGGTIGSVSVSLAYAANDGDQDAIRIGAGFEVGSGTNINVYYTAVDSDAVQTTNVPGLGATLVGLDDAYGIGFTHSLGGATLAGGIENDRYNNTRADFGVRFNF